MENIPDFKPLVAQVETEEQLDPSPKLGEGQIIDSGNILIETNAEDTQMFQQDILPQKNTVIAEPSDAETTQNIISMSDFTVNPMESKINPSAQTTYYQPPNYMTPYHPQVFVKKRPTEVHAQQTMTINYFGNIQDSLIGQIKTKIPLVTKYSAARNFSDITNTQKFQNTTSITMSRNNSVKDLSNAATTSQVTQYPKVYDISKTPSEEIPIS